MQSEFAIETSLLEGDGVLVSVRGEIDLCTTPDFKAAVSEAMSRGADAVVVDLTRTTFVDSSSLGVLIGAHRRLSRRGSRLLVVCDQPSVLKVLRVTGLDGVFDVVDSMPAQRDRAAVG